MINSTLRVCVLATLVATALTVSPASARSAGGFTADEIAVMCTSAYEVCYAACHRRSDSFSSTFDQQSCELQCDASFNACVGSYGGSNSAVTSDNPKQSRPSKKLPLVHE
jgi:hypothetical protein